jgi:hypothetical protein
VTAGARAALQFTRAQLRGVETSSLTESQLVHGLREHARSGQRLGQVLISLGYITDSQLTVALDRQRQPVTDTVRTTDAADYGWQKPGTHVGCAPGLSSHPPGLEPGPF